MHVSGSRTDFILTDLDLKPGDSERELLIYGGRVYGLCDPEGVAAWVDKSTLTGLRTDTLSFVIENAWGVAAKKRARYMQLLMFCLHNAFSAREHNEE